MHWIPHDRNLLALKSAKKLTQDVDGTYATIMPNYQAC
jgi:hypothetical protein